MTKMCVWKLYLIIGLLGMCIISCGDSELFNSDKMTESIEWEPDFILPVGYGDYTMWDLLNPYDPDESMIERDNRIIINYEEKDIVRLEAKDFWDMPEQQVSLDANLVLSPNSISGNLPQDIDISSNGETYFDFGEIGKLSFLSAKVRFSGELPAYSFNYIVTLTLPDVKDEAGNPYKLERVVNANQTDIFFEDRELEFDMNDESDRVRYQIRCFIPKDQEVEIAAGESLNLEFLLSDIVFHKVVGQINPPMINIDRGCFEMNIDFWNDVTGDFYFADPTLKLIVKSQGVDIPIKLMPDFIAYKEGETRDFTGEPLIFDTFNETGETVNEKGYTRDNSNVDELLSLPPKDSIAYSGNIFINEGGMQTACVIEENAELSADVKVEIPLYFKAENLTFRDTIKDIDLDNPDQIKKMALILRAKNGTPLKIGVKEFLMVDENFQEVDRIDADELIDVPEIDADGNVIAVKEGEHIVELSETNIDNLERTKHLILIASMATAGNGQTPVEVKADAKLELKVLVKVKLGIK
ncbi:hypothetical protein [uncultured Sanguibacteroides sp.]|uniref:hypothetical protein n=1 Tax=uncultured Sanguibacteroides sp. TaxID=1635151 RepID=UPI0025DC905B|nr:hypothetical protein [uncultured Sanguibacteroides sp.]